MLQPVQHLDVPICPYVVFELEKGSDFAERGNPARFAGPRPELRGAVVVVFRVTF